MTVDRRDFLKATGATALFLNAPSDLFANAAYAATPATGAWDTGGVRHILPTVSDTRMLVKVSLAMPQAEPPSLRIGATTVRGSMSDTRGEFWQFHATDLKPATSYQLSLTGNRGRALCQPWNLSTFPSPDARPEKLRVLFLSCVGGHEAMQFIPTTVRNRLLRRALNFQPQAAVVNGDHIYWDLLSPNTAKNYGASPEAERIAGKFDRDRKAHV